MIDGPMILESSDEEEEEEGRRRFRSEGLKKGFLGSAKGSFWMGISRSGLGARVVFVVWDLWSSRGPLDFGDSGEEERATWSLKRDFSGIGGGLGMRC